MPRRSVDGDAPTGWICRRNKTVGRVGLGDAGAPSSSNFRSAAEWLAVVRIAMRLEDLKLDRMSTWVRTSDLDRFSSFHVVAFVVIGPGVASGWCGACAVVSPDRIARNSVTVTEVRVTVS